MPDSSLHVLSIVHSPVYQGPHNTTAKVASLLAPEGVRTTVLLPDDGPEAAERMRAQGIEVVTMPLHRARARPDPKLQAEYFGTLPREVDAIARLIRERGIDVVDTNTLPNLHGGLAARKAGVACVWELIDTFPPPAMRRAYMPFVLGLSDVVMTTGVKVAAGHPGVQELGDRWVTYFPCVDVDRFTPDPAERAAARAELGLPADGTVIGNVAVMSPMKGHKYFIRAAAALRRTHPDATFVILGSRVEDREDYYAELFGEAAALGLVLGENLVNIDPGRRVKELAQAFDVFWMTSEPQSEGAPTVIGEAKALGLPVVTTDVGSCSECVADGVSGFVVPPRDPEAIAAATRRILDDPALAASMSAAARVEARADYDSPNGARAHRIAFERAVAHRATRPRRFHEPRRPAARRPSQPPRPQSSGAPMASTPTERRVAARRAYYPETAIDDFSRLDSAVEFYLRIDALLEPGMTVVDYGAGRGQWFEEPSSRTRTKLRDFRGRAAKVIGLDVDDAVHDNPTLTEAHVIDPVQPLPLPDASVDLVVSDYTFEHIDDASFVAAELSRVLKSGGWVCARTPNRWGYVGMGARAVPNGWHVRWLRFLQPGRQAQDVFPVRYQLNSKKDLLRVFPESEWEHVVYTAGGEPGYAGASPLAWKAIGSLLRAVPRANAPMLLIFLRKK